MPETKRIEENIAETKRRIAAAAARVGRECDDVLLVAVTKTRAADEVLAAARHGVLDVGENKVQELSDKHEMVGMMAREGAYAPNIRWHMIGHLQRNKVKYVVGKVILIHSVDSLRLAEEIDARAAQTGVRADVLIQVNASGEASKFGISPEDTGTLVRTVARQCANIRITGLMGIPPAADDPEDTRMYFRAMKALFDSIAGKSDGGGDDFSVLSMGMTHDFEVAVEEGSTLVRVGTGIFGPRNTS